MKRKPVERYMMFVVIVFAFFLLYLLITSNRPNIVAAAVYDGALSDDEAKLIASLGCEDLRQIIGTEKNVCIYLRDQEGNPVKIDDKLYVGCKGLSVEGNKVCG